MIGLNGWSKFQLEIQNCQIFLIGPLEASRGCNPAAIAIRRPSCPAPRCTRSEATKRHVVVVIDALEGESPSGAFVRPVVNFSQGPLCQLSEARKPAWLLDLRVPAPEAPRTPHQKAQSGRIRVGLVGWNRQGWPYSGSPVGKIERPRAGRISARRRCASSSSRLGRGVHAEIRRKRGGHPTADGMCLSS